MSQIFNGKGGEWTLLDEKGSEAVKFTSFISMNVSDEANTLSHPVEEGGFIHYNKIQSPRSISMTLAAQGDDADFGSILSRLEKYKQDAVMLTVVTPSAVYPKMTLKSYSNKRGQDGGAGMLIVDLSLTEVRESGTKAGANSVITRPKNPTSASPVDIGKLVAEEVPEYVLAAIRAVKYTF